MAIQVDDAAAHARSGSPSPRERRPDIQGLRALAILAVVAYHAGVPGISGGFVGVDFFFVLSGFLITGLLLSERQRKGRVSLANFWARRARRLLPASAAALIATAIAASIWLPVLDRRAVATDARWAALFGANWRFAFQETDYLAHDRSPSPILHFWSLGVEEQFYFVWPLLIAAIGFLVVAKFGQRARMDRIFLLVFGLISVVSLAYCVYETSASQPFAFFGTPARAWQLGIGACLAASVGMLRLTARTRLVLAAFGLAGFAVALLVLSESGLNGIKYPGLLALLPTVAAAALIAAGTGAEKTSLTRLLSIRPLQLVGDLSYSWYLWHWPVLVILPLIVESHAWPWRGFAVLLSFGLAWASYVLIEQPLRRSSTLVKSPAKSLLMGAAFIALIFVPAQVLSSASTDGKVINLTGKLVTVRPNPVDASADVFSMRRIGCDLDYDQVKINTTDCVFGDPEGHKRVILIGDSHAVAIYPGLNEAAKSEGWRLDSWTKSACPVADVTKYDPVVQGPFAKCDQYRDEVAALAIAAKPDLVVLAQAFNPRIKIINPDSGDLLSRDDARDAVVEGYRRTISRYTTAGIPVLVVEDLPGAPIDPPSCLVEKGRERDCLVRVPKGTPIEERAVEGLESVSLFNLREGVCTRHTCRPLKGDILVYRDTNHVTKTYALTLSARFASALDGN